MSILVISPPIPVTRIVVVSDAFYFIFCGLLLYTILVTSHNPIHNPGDLDESLVVVALFSSWAFVYVLLTSSGSLFTEGLLFT